MEHLATDHEEVRGPKNRPRIMKMEHLAIMKKSLNLLPKILSGEKTIESRWYSSRRAPFGRIKAGEVIYFKNSGEPVSAMATAGRVLEFENIGPEMRRDLARKYFREIGSSSEESLFRFSEGKTVAILVFLEKARPCEPFEIDKRGYGNMCAWISAERVPKAPAVPKSKSPKPPEARKKKI